MSLTNYLLINHINFRVFILSVYEFEQIYLFRTALGILLTKTTAVRNEVALSYHSVRGLYFLAVVFVTTIVNS